MSAAAAKKFTAAFRKVGMNYLDALTVQTTALRKVMKEPMRSDALGRSSFKYREFTYTDGKELPGVEVLSEPVTKKSSMA